MTRASGLVFVGGLHRSGTTLIAKLLAAHPDVSALTRTGVPEDEGQHLQDVYPPAVALGGPGRFAFADAAHLTESSPLVSDDSRDRLRRAWDRYWDSSCPWLIEKSPPNLMRFRFLQALFPGSAFVAVMRHPVPVAFATQRFYGTWHPWRRPTINALMRHWVHAHDVFEADAPFLDNLTIVRYEDLTRDPVRVLDGIANELGLSTGFAELSIDVRTDRSQRYFAAWRRHVTHPLFGATRRRHALELQQRVERWGYSLFEP